MKDLSKIATQIIESVEQLDEERVLKFAEKALEQGMEPLELLNHINEGMNRVGKLYESKEYYIADLIMAGLIFKGVLALDKMTAHFNGTGHKKIGKVIAGTVKGDIHDIGKDIFIGMLEANGFEVIDLGVDVPKETFVKKVIENKPHVLGLSGVLTHTLESMKDVIDALIEAGVRDQVKVIIGGDHLTEDACKYAKADNYATDAAVGVAICQQWMNLINQQGARE